jgi:hypothetical protein
VSTRVLKITSTCSMGNWNRPVKEHRLPRHDTNYANIGEVKLPNPCQNLMTCPRSPRNAGQKWVKGPRALDQDGAMSPAVLNREDASSCINRSAFRLSVSRLLLTACSVATRHL